MWKGYVTRYSISLRKFFLAYFVLVTKFTCFKLSCFCGIHLWYLSSCQNLQEYVCFLPTKNSSHLCSHLYFKTKFLKYRVHFSLHIATSTQWILRMLLPEKSKRTCAMISTLKTFSKEYTFISEKAMAPHSSTLAWKIPWTEEPGRLQSMELLRVGLDWVISLSLSCIGEGNGNLLQCSCLENPRDGGAWWAAVYGVAQSRTRLKRLSSSSSIVTSCIPLTKFSMMEWGSIFLPGRMWSKIFK